MTDDLGASKIDVKFLVTLAVVFAGVIIGWTANREAVKRNRADVDRLGLVVETVVAEQVKLGNRLLVIENGIPYRIETVNEINRKLDRLIGESRPSSVPDRPQ